MDLNFPSEKNSILNWKLLSEGLSGKNKNFENKSLETQDFNPIFPDTNEFSHDIYYNEKASTLVYPIKFPNKKQTSELELYDLYNSNFIRRRFTLRTPIDGNIGTEKFKYDTYIEYNMIGDIIEKKESNYHSRVTNSRYSYIVFLLKGIVINYIFIQEVRDKNDNFVLGPQNISKDDFSKENFSNLRLSYLKQRSSLFRRIVANEWFYQDYLNLPPKSKDQIIRLNLENLEEFPDLLYEFKNLKELNISKSAIKTINCNSLKDLKFLESLSLYETLISEIPACINNLPKLKKLMLDQNKIKSIDKAIVQNATISELSLNGNDLRIENKLNPNLKNLTHIYLSRNYIEEIPESWKSLSKLNYIEINSNKINKVPKNLDVLISLEYIYLEKNNIDSFPESLLKNNNLSRLDLSDNNIKYLPEVLCKEISYKNGNPIIYLANNPLNEENLRKIHACNKSYSIFPKPTN